jgi:phenylalanyl-tRNA synthetase beta chain
MKASIQWLRSLVPSLEASDEELVAALARGGHDVRSVTKLDGELNAVDPQDGEVPTDIPCEEAVPAAFDTILDLADSDRGDLLGHVGLARELAALCRLPFVPPGVDAPIRVAEGSVQTRIDVDVHEGERCPHFGLLVIEDVVVRPSPLWLRVRLHALGLEPRNNVLDLTQLVALESGHPVTVFDLAGLEGPLVVRLAEDGETLGVGDREHSLRSEDLVVADAQGPVAVAGVTNASRTDVGASTQQVVFACGCFSPEGIRCTADRLGMNTESSRRHRRGVDRNDTAEVLAQAGALATRLAMGAAVPGTIHVFDEPWQATQVVLSRSAVLEAIDVPLELTKAILGQLGFEVVPLHADAHGDGLQVSIPSFRPDVRTEADVMKEIGRIHRAWSSAGIG